MVSGESLPVYSQVAAELRREIADGEVKPGQRLPPARDLAAVMGVNHNTMFRALRESVAGEAPGLSEVVMRCRELLMYSRKQGYPKEEILRIIEGISCRDREPGENE
jgi:GntR family transcriptional regulator